MIQIHPDTSFIHWKPCLDCCCSLNCSQPVGDTPQPPYKKSPSRKSQPPKISPRFFRVILAIPCWILQGKVLVEMLVKARRGWRGWRGWLGSGDSQNIYLRSLRKRTLINYNPRRKTNMAGSKITKVLIGDTSSNGWVFYCQFSHVYIDLWPQIVFEVESRIFFWTPMLFIFSYAYLPWN